MQAHLRTRPIQLKQRALPTQRQHGLQSLHLDQLQVARICRQLHQLRRSAKLIQDKHPVGIRQVQPFGHLGHPLAFVFPLRRLFLVQGSRLFHRRRTLLLRVGRLLSLPFSSRRPIHQRGRKLFPISAPLHADVPHSVAHHFILADNLVGAVLQNQPMIHLHARNIRLQRQRLTLRLVIGLPPRQARGAYPQPQCQSPHQASCRNSPEFANQCHRRQFRPSSAPNVLIPPAAILPPLREAKRTRQTSNLCMLESGNCLEVPRSASTGPEPETYAQETCIANSLHRRTSVRVLALLRDARTHDPLCLPARNRDAGPGCAHSSVQLRRRPLPGLRRHALRSSRRGHCCHHPQYPHHRRGQPRHNAAACLDLAL